jgi:four helix bundle protein
MKAARGFEDLIVWQKAHQLVLSIYRATKGFPRSELYGLVGQVRRSAVSIAANIAEGFRKRSKAEKSHYLNIAHGSLEETRYYLILSKDLGYCEVSGMMTLSDEVSRLLMGYRKKIDEG